MTNLVLGLDADDFLCNDCLEKMLKRMSVTNSDVVFQRMVFFDQDTNKIKYTIPVEEFDMSLELSGEEAFVRTIGGWQIGFNGGLWRKSIYNKVPPGKEMNSDELTFRKRILFARKVAFCDVNYYMRLHRKSTTHLISVKLFDRLIVDHLLEKMVKKIYSEESGIPEKMRKERLINLINHQVLFVKIKTKLNPSEKSTVHKILERCYKNQSFRDLKRELPFHWKIAFLNSYFWFSIGSFFYYIIKPSKIFCSELWEK